MDDNYLDKMSKYENLCLAWLRKADQEYIENDFKHNKQECYYLQQAINQQSEMARISIGAEKEFHVRKAKELNYRLAEIIRVIDPEYFQRKQEEAKAKISSTQKDKTEKPSEEKAPKRESDDAVDDNEVKSWFKEIPNVSFKDVTGMDALKKKLNDCIADSKRNAIKEYLGLKKQKSYFFVGPPGSGKTHLIQAFAHELVNKDYKYISLDGSDILSKYVGDAEKTITRLFEEAEKNAPCIVFIDEIDGVCKNRSLENLPEYAASITTAFLTGYNRLTNSDKPVIFIGATNYPSKVDNAMLDRVELIHVPFPDKEGRILKFKQELEEKIQLIGGLTFEEIGNMTEAENENRQYNYRDIGRLCENLKLMVMDLALNTYPTEEKAIEALKNGECGISPQLFREATEKCVPTPKKDIVKEYEEWFEQFERRAEV